MKILLLGELSSFHSNLKEGLENLGHDVRIAGYSEGWKKINVDFNLDSNWIFPLNKFHRIFRPFTNNKIFTNNDIVQFISPLLFQPLVNGFINHHLTKHNNKSFLAGVSSGDPYYHYGLKYMDYTPFDESINKKKERYYPKFSRIDINTHKKLLEEINGYIPSCFDYYYGYKILNQAKLKNIIPYPINLKTFNVVTFPSVTNKVKLFHGISRYDFKGSKYIIEAMNIIKRKYPNDISIEIVEQLPYQEYVKRLDNSHVILDQCRSYSYAMNSLISLAKGKISLSGAEPIALEAMNIDNCPVLNIKPDSQQIVSSLEKLLENRNMLDNYSFLSREYVEKYHDSNVIAQKYIDTWSK